MLDGIPLGCNGRGVQHIAGEPVTVDEQFRLLKSAGVYDHFDRMLTRHAHGHLVTDREVLDFYLHAHDLGQKIGIDIGFEAHMG